MHGPKHFIFLFLPLDTHEQSQMTWELTHEETVPALCRNLRNLSLVSWSFTHTHSVSSNNTNTTTQSLLGQTLT